MLYLIPYHPKSVIQCYQFSIIILPSIAMAYINLFSELMNSGFGSLATASDPCKWTRKKKNWKADMQALNPQRTSGFSGCNLSVFCVIACVVCLCVSVCVCVCVCACWRDAFMTDRWNWEYKKLSTHRLSPKMLCNTDDFFLFSNMTTCTLFIISLGYMNVLQLYLLGIVIWQFDLYIYYFFSSSLFKRLILFLYQQKPKKFEMVATKVTPATWYTKHLN